MKAIYSNDTSTELYPILTDRLYDELSGQNSVSLRFGPVYVNPEQKNTLVFDFRKYYDQAINYQKALVLAAEGKSIPYFPVKLSDLSPSLKKDLDELLNSRQLEFVLKEAVLKIYSDIDNDYNQVFPEHDEQSNRYRINIFKQMVEILRVELIP